MFLHPCMSVQSLIFVNPTFAVSYLNALHSAVRGYTAAVFVDSVCHLSLIARRVNAHHRRCHRHRSRCFALPLGRQVLCYSVMTVTVTAIGTIPLATHNVSVETLSLSAPSCILCVPFDAADELYVESRYLLPPDHYMQRKRNR